MINPRDSWKSAPCPTFIDFAQIGSTMVERNRQDKKRTIAEVASRVFFDKGYQKASLQDVANELGVSKATIFHYFKTKEQLLYFIIENNTNVHMAELKDHLKQCQDQKLPPQETFQEVMTKYATALNEDIEVPQIILRERHQLTGENKEGLHRIEREIFRFIRDEIKKVPNIDKRYDVNVIAFLLISFSHWMKYWLKEDGELSIEDAIKQVLDMVCYGMLDKNRS